ncbi:MAG: UbiD family decarboxylase [Chromatiales bacterium]|jgi:2,5-furandicarboxylate decarboxylase 1|nr:UbiD family decarboxylase [Chromatiales bacterium]
MAVPTTLSNRPKLTTLRALLKRLAATDRLAVAKPGISLDYELAAVAKRLDGDKASLFPAPVGAHGSHSMSVVSGLVSDRSWFAEAMGLDDAGLLEAFQHAVANPLPWVECAEAPVQAHISLASEEGFDLGRLLPIPKHNKHDSGQYITAGLVIARNPRTGVQNVSINRLQLSGPDRLGILILPRHLHHFYEAAEAAGGALPCAIVIGVDPMTLLASQAILPLDHDELEVAGALQGEGLPVVKCRTSDVRVPALAEIVIEGRLLPKVREPEGPFGEFPQYYGPSGDREVVQIDAVTRRDEALFHTIVPAAMEHLLLGGIAREASILSLLQRSFPGVVDVHLPKGGTCRYHLVVKLKKRWEGEPVNVMMGAFAAHADIKHVVVVDEDVDIHDAQSVEWAIATRFQAARDTVIVPRAQGSKLDPSASDGISDKMGIDATAPVAKEGLDYTVVHVPGEDDPAMDAWIEDAPAQEWTDRLGD